MRLKVIADPTCTRCVLSETTTRVCILGTGPVPVDVMVIGEAPGRREEQSGEPFTGAAGHLLTGILETHGIIRDRIYICNAVSCRPPQNRTPKKKEIAACRHWLTQQIKAVKPKFVLLLGNVPLIAITGSGGITKVRGHAFERDGIIYLPTYHPAFILRDERNRAYLEADIRLFSQIIKLGRVPREEGLNFVIVDTEDKFAAMLKAIKGKVSFDVETTSLYPWDSGSLKENPHFQGRVRTRGIVSIGIGTKGTQWCLPIDHPGSPWPRSRTPGLIRDLDRRIGRVGELITHNGKFDNLWMRHHHGVDWRPTFDTMLAHYLVDENTRHSLKLLSQIYCGAPDYDEDLKVKTGEQGTLEEHCRYLAHDVYYTRQLRFILDKQLRQDDGISRVFDLILMPLARLFCDIEYHGVCVDVPQMKEVERYLHQQIDDALAELKQYGDINWGSPKQLGNLLFNELKLPVLDRTPKGAASTNESVLLRIDHPLTTALLKFRGAKQQLSFFIDGWKPFLVNGRLHPSFKLHGAVTGRASCEHPNLQQVPRDPRIRTLITAPAGWTLVECDLSQVEMRIAAELAGEQVLIGLFDRGEDVHWQTAIREIARGGGYRSLVKSTAKVHRNKRVSYAASIRVLLDMGPDRAIEIDEQWKEIRKKAKAVNFGYLFGMWWRKFMIYARDSYGITVTEKQAKESRTNFFDLYPALASWHERSRRFVRRNGYVRSLSGRLRRLPAAMSPYDSPERGNAERQAINTPVQSFANELNFMMVLQLASEFPNEVRIVGTVHDAILMEVADHAVERVAERCLIIARRPSLMDDFGIKLRVPIEAEVKIGPWGKGVSLDKWRSSLSTKAKSTNGGNVIKRTITGTSKSLSAE